VAGPEVFATDIDYTAPTGGSIKNEVT